MSKLTLSFKGRVLKIFPVLQGEMLEVPEPAALERDAPEPLSKEEQLEELARLREESGL